MKPLKRLLCVGAVFLMAACGRSANAPAPAPVANRRAPRPLASRYAVGAVYPSG